MWRFSNSHLGDYFSCPRLGFNRYYAGGTGFVKRGMNWDTAMGSLSHSICCGALLNKDVDKVVLVAQAEFEMEMSRAGVADMDFVAARYMALGEGLARTWIKQRLPIIQQYYEVLGSECEYLVPLAPDVELMIRPDCEVRRKQDGEIFALEFKTTGYNGLDYFDSWGYSTQTLTHCLGLDNKYGKPAMGVMMEFLYKGTKRKDKDGVEQWYSPLIRGYSAGPLPPFGSETIEWDSSFSKKKGYAAVNTWEKMPIAQWVDSLPEEVLMDQLATREIYRKQDELAVWQRQTLALERRIRDAAELFDPEVWAIPDERECKRAMDEVFPARKDRYCVSNEYRKKCPYLDVCFKGAELNEENGFEQRKPHHEGEWEE